MAEPNNTNNNPAPGSEPTPAVGGEVTFTQAQVDALIAREKAKATAKATKGMPTAEELDAFRKWQEEHQTDEQKMAAIIKERDDGKMALSSVQAELEALKHEKYVLSKGVAGDEAEFIAFKAAKMVDDKTTFEQAVDKIVGEHKSKPTFDWTPPTGGGDPKQNVNQTMNALIRGALK